MVTPAPWKKIVFVAAAAFAALTGAFLAGFVVAEESLFLSSQLLYVKSRLRSALGRPAEAKLGTELNTALLRLSVQTVQVPGETESRGGGITRAGDSLLGVTGAGLFFQVRGEDVQPLDIQPPPQFLEEYRRAAATPELASLVHNFGLMRYYAPFNVATPERNLLFLTYTEWQDDQRCYRLALARLEIPAADALGDFSATAADWKVVFRTSPCLPLLTTHDALQGHMGAGVMAYDASAGRLLLATGDYRLNGVYAPRAVSQEEGATYGRLLSMDLDGGAVTELARGLRNAQGLLLLPGGEVWFTDHGPRGGDELNRLVPGANYGWPYRTLGTRYSALPWPLSPTNGRHDVDPQYTGPVHAWVPSVGIAGLARVEGFDAAWDGDLLAAAMRGQTLYRLRVTEGRVQYSEPIRMPERLRQVLQLPDGVIALWTDSHKVLYLRRAAESRTLLRARREMEMLGGGDAPRTRRLEQALQACMECHSLDPDAAGNVPHLNGVVGRAVASTPWPGWSASLRMGGGHWTRERLAAFLTDPQQFAPGTSMPDPGLPAETTGDLVALFERLNSPE